MKALFDLNGDGINDILVTGSGALGILGMQSGALTVSSDTVGGTWIGPWQVNPNSDAYNLAGDVDGDGTAELFVTSTGGAGFLKFGPNGVSCPYQIPNGQEWGGWRFDTSNNEFGPLADLDADGRAELLVTSPWGLAVLAPATTGFLSPVCAANGTVFSDWTVDTTDDAFGPAADFDGDGRAEIVMANSAGLRLLRLGNGTLDTIASLPNSTSLAGTSFDSTAIVIAAAADFDGDGAAELLVVGTETVWLLKLANNTLSPIASVALGAWAGGWLAGGQNRWGPAADYNGDGRVEVLVQSNWGIGLVALSNGAFITNFTASNGTLIGQWRLDTLRDRLNIARDLDGDGRAELFASGPWGIGVLDMSGAAPTSKTLAASGSTLGSWSLDMITNDFEQGRGRGLILFDAQSIPGTVTALQARGYVVIASDQSGLLARTIRRFATGLGISDRLFVHFWTDGGSTDRVFGETDNAPCGQHFLQTDDGGLWLSNFAPYFSRAAWGGVDITVLDSSCHGGETVVDAIGERYCAMSMTGVFEVAQLHTPDPLPAIESSPRPGVFGAWYSGPRNGYSLLNGILLRNSIIDRVQQRVYRNDNLPTTLITILGRDGLRATVYASPWYVTNMGQCYLSQYVDPGEYNSSICTKSGPSFFAWLASEVNPQLPAIEAYKTHVFNHPQADEAEELFYANFAIIWQTLAGDLTWNPIANPEEYSGALLGIDPSRYYSTSGFSTMVADASALITTIENSYWIQLGLLESLDAALQNTAQQGQLVRPQTDNTPPPFKVASQDPRLLHSLDAYRNMSLEPADTGLGEVDSLVAQYQQACSDHYNASCQVTFLLAILEDVLMAVESQGQVNTADYVFY